ncbi:MAG: hypothetical protein IT436_12140 [Phycisphaerales bacterium]|nr:hypothetical protein [Phycisphaerales bacterium]
MILCRYQGYWFLTPGVSRDRGTCGLQASARMPYPKHFESPCGSMVSGAVPPDEVTFYPEARWRGHRVWPLDWDWRSSEPRLRCQLDETQLFPGGEGTYADVVEELRRAGWSWDHREGGYRYLHPDDLELVEGPPPVCP